MRIVTLMNLTIPETKHSGVAEGRLNQGECIHRTLNTQRVEHGSNSGVVSCLTLLTIRYKPKPNVLHLIELIHCSILVPDRYLRDFLLKG